MRIVLIIAALAASTNAVAQVEPVPTPPPTVAVGDPPEPQEQPLLQNDLVLKTGSDRIFFGPNDHLLSPPARTTLAAQARWLLANPGVRAIIEGHADERTPRDLALALGERRATAVRNYLVALGVPSWRLLVTSWGKERPVAPLPGIPNSGQSNRVVTVIVR